MTTTPCPHCGEPIPEDAPRCPYCEQYTSEEDAPRRGKSAWLWVGLIVALLLSLFLAIR